jgi:hypothetical protein
MFDLLFLGVTPPGPVADGAPVPTGESDDPEPALEVGDNDMTTDEHIDPSTYVTYHHNIYSTNHSLSLSLLYSFFLITGRTTVIPSRQPEPLTTTRPRRHRHRRRRPRLRDPFQCILNLCSL